ncbi:low-temperature-induced 65 kDa protein-like isoform X2 [Phalaenopsis equestris]|uniref:low-temperature-induced 65 kDa protein-like isoform X2 n=1 Tax=Phalaenopsis equestris TaxID=78828 RepID=UPI0009E58475|nr:low-temperature-induced 65 kDa protein-like isoform X2 [Phalaenopsis equestris]
MDSVTPSSTYLHGEHPPRTGEQDEDHHEKKPVLKKVMDKVKKIKKAISKKSPRHGKEGDGDDHHQEGDLDEEEEEFEEDDEINEDRAVHGGSAAGAGIAAREIPGGEEATKGAGDGLSFIREQFDKNQAKPRTYNETDTTTEQGRSLPNPIIEPKRENESSATGVNEVSRGGETAEGVGDGSPLTTEKFVGDLTAPTDDPKTKWGIEQSRAYESPATNVRTGENEGAERVSDGLGIIKEESVEDPGAPRNEVYESPTTGARTGASERVKNGLALITDDFIQDSSPPSTEAETNTRSELTRANESPTSGARTGANQTLGEGREDAKGVTDGLGLLSKDFVRDPAATRSNDDYETNKIIEQSQVHLSPTSARSGMNELSGRAEEGAEAVSDGLGLVTDMELVEDPAAPKDEAEKNTNTEQGRGKEVEIAPELCRSLEAMTVSPQNERGEAELPKGGNNSYTGMVSSAASKVYEMVTDAGTAVISKVKPEASKDGEGEAVVNQSKGRSITDYITEKLTPGEDEKTLSELITEAGQRRNNETVEVPRQAVAPSGEEERGTGVVDKIKETFTSLLGGGGGSPKSPAAGTQRKETEYNDDFLGRPPEAISQEKGSNEELPTSYH